MESHSDESSPLSREIECDHRQPLPAAAKVKLMCSYGGRILPRPHDNQISYVGGETKILAVDRSIRFPAFLARAAALLPGGGGLCFKYQLPGEDLDALISVTDDEDLEHMMIEYDRLVRRPAGPSPRLRLFLFVTSSAAAGPPLEEKEKKAEKRQWFEDALSLPPAGPIYTVSATPSVSGPDFLFGLDKGSAPATEANVEPEPEIVSPPAPAEVSPLASEIQRQIEELQQLQIEASENHQELQRQQIVASENHQLPQQIAASENHQLPQQRQQIAASENHQLPQQQQQIAAAENYHQQQQIMAAENHQHQQQAPMQRNGSSDDVVAAAARVPARDYYMKAGPPAIPAGYWAQKAGSSGGEQQQAVYLIPAAPGMFPGHPGAYYAAVPRMAAAVGRPAPGKATTYQVAYDSAGRAVYYTGAVVPTYQMMGPVSAGVVEDSKPAQVS